MSLHLLGFFNFSCNVLQLTVFKSCTSFVNFNTNYLVSDALKNGTIFLFSFSDCLLPVYKTQLILIILILYPTNLAKITTSSSIFAINSIKSSMQTIMLSANKHSFISFFPFWVLGAFIYSLDCLFIITLSRNQQVNTELTWECAHPFLGFDLMGKHSAVHD